MDKERGPLPHPELPTALAEFLRGHEQVAITQETQWGTTLILKAPRAEFAALAGPVPVQLRHALYRLQTAPVIRMLTALVDRTGPEPEALIFETFFNVADAQQRREYALLATQGALPIVGYDEGLQRVLAKRVALTNGPEIARLLTAADAIRAAIPAERYDFDRAKRIVIARTAF